MITDSQMHIVLREFAERHKMLLPDPQIIHIDEGTFTTVTRMRTMMPISIPTPYPKATTLELRGEWHYPMMMMNDFMPITPDPPMILLRDEEGGVVVRFKPCSIDDATRILHDKVFDLDGAHLRIEQKRAMESKEAFLAVKQKELDNEIQNAIDAAVSKCDIHALAAMIS